MKLATWNVNSLKVRLPHVLDWLQQNPVDVLCLQETKCVDEAFPCDAIRSAGYEPVFCGQKTYNGVAVLSKKPVRDTISCIPNFEDNHKRALAVTVDDLRVICVYVPNGAAVGSEKYAYKLKWLKATTEWLREEVAQYPKLAVLGDFNIAPEDRDVHDPVLWQGNVMVSAEEREAFARILGLGLEDSFRLFDPEPGTYTWWDYRVGAFRRNMGLRIDHILLSRDLIPLASSCHVDKLPRKWERPSDHAPVVVELK